MQHGNPAFLLSEAWCHEVQRILRHIISTVPMTRPLDQLILRFCNPRRICHKNDTLDWRELSLKARSAFWCMVPFLNNLQSNQPVLQKTRSPNGT